MWPGGGGGRVCECPGAGEKLRKNRGQESIGHEGSLPALRMLASPLSMDKLENRSETRRNRMANNAVNICLIGDKFMGRAHSNAYLKVDKFFNLPVRPVM